MDVIQQAIVAQDRIIRKIADNGSCVIVGRAADYVLRDYKNVLRIFVHAPETYRINRVMETYGDSDKDAAQNIRRSDNARASYYKNISGQEWGNSKNYHICIDSSIGVDKCADVILSYINAALDANES